jgi:hypothetical protein
VSQEIEYHPQRLFSIKVCASTDLIDQAAEQAKAFLQEMVYNTTPVGVEAGRIQLVLSEDNSERSEEEHSTTWRGSAAVDIEVDPRNPVFADDIHKWLDHINGWDASLNLYLGQGRDQILWMSVESG